MTRAPFVDWKSMVHFLRCLQAQNDDAVVIIDGAEGAGKSSLAFYIAHQLEYQWNPEHRLIIDHEDWQTLYTEGQGGRTYLLDEGGNLMFSRNAMTGQNKGIVLILQMARELNNILLVCCPSIYWLDRYVREHRAIIHIRVHKLHHGGGVERGHATAHWRSIWIDQDGVPHYKWRAVFNIEFKAIPKTDPEWRAYAAIKTAKIQKQAHALLGGRERWAKA